MIFFTPVILKYMKNDLEIKKHRYSEQILPVPWTFVMSNFHCSQPFKICIMFTCIECFHSRGQHLCKFNGTKESVCIRKEFNSYRTGLGHQHGRRDVMWKHSIYMRINYYYCCYYYYNDNYNKILKSDCLLTVLISALTGQFNRTVCVMHK